MRMPVPSQRVGSRPVPMHDAALRNRACNGAPPISVATPRISTAAEAKLVPSCAHERSWLVLTQRGSLHASNSWSQIMRRLGSFFVACATGAALLLIAATSQAAPDQTKEV